jgi:hypothetical protein
VPFNSGARPPEPSMPAKSSTAFVTSGLVPHHRVRAHVDLARLRDAELKICNTHMIRILIADDAGSAGARSSSAVVSQLLSPLLHQIHNSAASMISNSIKPMPVQSIQSGKPKATAAPTLPSSSPYPLIPLAVPGARLL